MGRFRTADGEEGATHIAGCGRVAHVGEFARVLARAALEELGRDLAVEYEVALRELDACGRARKAASVSWVKQCARTLESEGESVWTHA